jgi:hypothetical protein
VNPFVAPGLAPILDAYFASPAFGTTLPASGQQEMLPASENRAEPRLRDPRHVASRRG